MVARGRRCGALMGCAKRGCERVEARLRVVFATVCAWRAKCRM
ncbi:hypothetical protein BVRB_8g188710 [Beta vulgaris subsp. vulgaris]|nr:hypothetical protein BVRB_8g188710 [Beta vulgaris subsp. vulgaris]